MEIKRKNLELVDISVISVSYMMLSKIYYSGKDIAYLKEGKIHIVKAPRMEISSSFIRQAIQKGKDVSYYLPEAVYTYIKEMHFYE